MTRLWIGGAALLLVLTGCGGDPKAEPSPAPSSPRTSPVSTTPSAPVMPEEAKADTKAGAVAFVKYYIELINHAQATGDVGAITRFDSTECQSCSQASAAIEAIYGVGGSIEGGNLEAEIGSAAKRPDVMGWTVFANVSYDRQTIVRPNGTKTLSGGQSVLTFIVKMVDTEWKVLQWSRGS